MKECYFHFNYLCFKNPSNNGCEQNTKAYFITIVVKMSLNVALSTYLYLKSFNVAQITPMYGILLLIYI